MFDPFQWVPTVGKLGTIGMAIFFIAYLIYQNNRLQGQVENLVSKHEVGTKTTVEAMGKLTEVITLLKAEILGRLRD